MDIAGYVVRVRRVADLSQRELAAALGVSSSCIAKIEAGRQRASADLFARIVELAGLRLAVLDAEGHECSPVDPDVVRDNARRRFPAHLDVSPPDLVPLERRRSPRYDRYTARGWYQHRRARDGCRAVKGEPIDHPTVTELASRNHRLIIERRLAMQRAHPPEPRADECSCKVWCWIEAGCLAPCICQCEPSSAARTG